MVSFIVINDHKNVVAHGAHRSRHRRKYELRDDPGNDVAGDASLPPPSSCSVC
jgi:hypothetical protein